MFRTEELQHIFSSFEKLRVMIVGDVMVDSYLWGKVDRISPEAPVPVVSLSKREYRPGGAANVALNVQAMGATPVLCAVIGKDLHGAQFLDLLREHNLTSACIVQSNSRITTTKFRIIGNNSHMLRVDEETDERLSDEDETNLMQLITAQIENGLDAIIFEDYDKGMISQALIEKTVQLAQSHNIAIAVDPKKRNFLNYSGVQLFKPNLKELREGLKLDSINPHKDELDSILFPFLKANEFQMLMVTLSEAGVYMGYREADSTFRSVQIPAHFRKITDVSGAGDTVIALAALGLALDLEPGKIAALSNMAGGLACEDVGVVPVNRDKLLEEAKEKLTDHE